MFFLTKMLCVVSQLRVPIGLPSFTIHLLFTLAGTKVVRSMFMVLCAKFKKCSPRLCIRILIFFVLTTELALHVLQLL